MSFDLSSPFRGSTALAAGLLTPGVLRGPRFRRLFPDVYVHTAVEVDLAVRARAAHLLTDGRGVIGGYAAAELLDASCGPEDAPVDLVLPGRAYREHPGLVVHRGLLLPDETTAVHGIAVTSPIRTAYDLGRNPSPTEAVVALDALSHRWKFRPDSVLDLGCGHLGARGSAQLPQVVRLANPLAESPMEQGDEAGARRRRRPSLLSPPASCPWKGVRLVIVLAGLPVPVLQHPIGSFFLDLAYPAVRLAIEYDGRAHREQVRAMRDLDRQAYLSDAGWKVLRFTAAQVLCRPWWVATRVREELVRAAHRHGVTLDQLGLR